MKKKEMTSMRFKRDVVKEARECPYGGLRAHCPHCSALMVEEAARLARSRYGEDAVVRLAWLIGIAQNDPGLEHAARRVMRRRGKVSIGIEPSNPMTSER
ncbi:hypothetical protein ABZV67_19300 [Streptomyces sp. NPDC005065]|uniref:hypothetical protein n=1 Tax=Streptomyces sp. NPDC005065 TaxID=3154461 RepID=UPI0033A4C20B